MKNRKRIFSPGVDDGKNNQPAGVTGKFYVDGNYMDGAPDVTKNNWKGIEPKPKTMDKDIFKSDTEFPFENTTKWFIYSQQYRQDAIKDAQVLRSRGEQVELMPLTEQNTKAVYEKYAEENHIQDIIFYM